MDRFQVALVTLSLGTSSFYHEDFEVR